MASPVGRAWRQPWRPARPKRSTSPTPVFVHAAQTIAALRAGRHVLCEKPMAMDYQQAVTIEQAAEETGRTLGIAYYRRMYPKVERARELLARGAVGRPVFAEATSHDWFYPAGAAREWLLDPAKAGGGPLYDIACHRIDLMNYLFRPAGAGHRVPFHTGASKSR